jgi:co-chaperonin GroES (HSP10)
MKNNYVLVKELEQKEEIAQSGIILPNEKYNRKAIVIESDCDELKPNDIIIRTLGNGTTFKINGDEYEILHECYILAIIENYGTETTGT